VQRREDEVAGLRRRQRGAHRLLVAHLADEDHIRVLTQDPLERRLERQRVLADLALVDDRVLVAVQELDRVLDRDDVLLMMRVHPVDHRRERGGLARARRAGDEDDSALLVGQVVDDRRQVELLDRLDVDGIARKTNEIELRWWKAFTRKRPASPMPNEKSSSCSRGTPRAWPRRCTISRKTSSVSSGSSLVAREWARGGRGRG
jgi:hypothetical protein